MFHIKIHIIRPAHSSRYNCQLVMSVCDPAPGYDPVVIRNNRLQSGCIFWQPADFSANSDGVIRPGAEWGRLWLQCMRQAPSLHRASSRDMNPFPFRHSWRSLPLNDATVALSVGVPGREKSVRIPRSYTHLSGIFPANSGPLSVFSNCGKGRPSAMVSSIPATSVERRFCPHADPRTFACEQINYRQQA